MTELFFQTEEPDADAGMGIVPPTDEDPAEESIDGEEDLGDVTDDGITDDEDELE